MKFIFIVNPLAGEGSRLEEIKNKVSALDLEEEWEIYPTKGVNDATEYIRQYGKEHPEEEVCFVACGGDGTINEVFNGVIGNEKACVACYPCGSGNDFVKAFGGVDKFMDMDKVIHGTPMKIDLLKVGDRYSDNIVNFGFDTTVAITVNEGRDKKGSAGKNLYTKGIIKALIKSMKNSFEVYADGELINPEGKALLCTLGNGQYVGGSFKTAPRAKLDDGLMEVCLLKPISRIRFVQILGTYTEGKHLDDPKMKDIVVYRQAKKVEVKAPKGFAYSLDGEIIYEDEFTVEVAPQIVTFMKPE